MSTSQSTSQHEQTLSTRRIHEGRIINLREDTVRLPSGREGKREIVEHKGASCVVPVLSDGRIVMVRQWRHATGEALLEIPAGGLNEGEDPQTCAERELAEEVNLRGEFSPLFSVFLAPGYSTELIHCFVAQNCTPAEGTPDDDENLEVLPLPLDELLRLIDAGEIRDSKTLCGVLAWARRASL